MRRLRRILANALAGLSLVLCLVAAALWGHSATHLDGIGFRGSSRYYELFSDRGQVCFEVVETDNAHPLDGLHNLTRVSLSKCWAFSIRRPPERRWYGDPLGINGKAGIVVPYQRWGFKIESSDPGFPLLPSSWLYWDWRENYSANIGRMRRGHPEDVRRSPLILDRWNFSVFKGLRDVPYWTEVEFASERAFPGLAVAMPHWAAALVFSLVPFGRVFGLFRARARRNAGLCPICNYDLRATPDRCPECGAVPKQCLMSKD